MEYKTNSYFQNFLSFGQNMKQITMVEERKCVEMQDLHAILFNSRLIFNKFCKFYVWILENFPQ
jgi:hypothetical protein